MKGIYNTQRNAGEIRRTLLKIVRGVLLVTRAVVVSAGGCSNLRAQDAAANQSKGCDQGNAGLTLPPGFCASVFADNLGRARHLRDRFFRSRAAFGAYGSSEPADSGRIGPDGALYVSDDVKGRIWKITYVGGK